MSPWPREEAGICREVCAEEAAALRAAASVDASRASAWQQLALTSLMGTHEAWCLKRAMLSWTQATELRQVRAFLYAVLYLTKRPSSQATVSSCRITGMLFVLCRILLLRSLSCGCQDACPLPLTGQAQKVQGGTGPSYKHGPHISLGRMEQAACEKACTTVSPCLVARQGVATGLCPVAVLCGAQPLKARQRSKGLTRPSLTAKAAQSVTAQCNT